MSHPIPSHFGTGDLWASKSVSSDLLSKYLATTRQAPDRSFKHLPKGTKVGVASRPLGPPMLVGPPRDPQNHASRIYMYIKYNILYQHICKRKLPPPFGTWIGLKHPELVSSVRSNSKGPWLLYMSTLLCAIRLFSRTMSLCVYPCKSALGQNHITRTYHFVCSSIHITTTLKTTTTTTTS